MRIERIIIHNIASIADATIDFTQKPLSDAALFLISGETGTGKTTILDCISLALYGKTPRFDANKSSKDVLIDSLSYNRAEQLMRKGTANAFAELVFTEKQETYTARWEVVKRNKRNSKEITYDTSHTLCHNETVIDGKEAARKRIQEILGLDFNQFFRTTILAQGEFTKFLFSNENEKVEILEKLTNTEKFAAIGKRVSDIEKEKRTAYETKASETSTIEKELLTTERKEEIKLTITNSTTEIEFLKKRQEEIGRKKTWIESEQRLAKDIASLKERRHNIELTKNSAEFRQKERNVAEWNLSSQARTALQTLNEKSAQLTARQQQLAEQEHIFAILLGCTEQHQDLLEKDTQRIEKGKLWLQSKAPFAAMYEQSQCIVSELKTIQKRKANIEENQRRKDDAEKRIVLLKASVEAAQKAAEQAKQQTNEKKRETELLAAQLQALNLSSLQQQKSDAENALLKISTVTEAQKHLASDVKELEKTLEDISANQKKLQNLEAQKAILEEKKNHAEKDSVISKELYENLLQLNDYIVKKYRQTLNVGDTCPVCGKEITDALHNINFNAELAEAEAKKNTAQKTYDEAFLLFNQNEIERRTISSVIDTLKKNARSNEERIAQTRRDIQQQCLEIGLPESESDTAAFLQTKRDATCQKLDEIAASIAKGNELQRRINTLNNEFQSLADTLRKKNEELSEAEKSRVSLSSDIQNFSKNIQRETDEIQASIQHLDGKIAYDNWLAEWSANNQDFIAKLECEEEEYRKGKDGLVRLENDVANLKSALETIEACRKNVLDKQPGWNNIPSIKSEKRQHLTHDWTVLQSSVAELSSSISSLAKEIDANKETLREFHLSHSGIDAPRLAELLAFSQAQIAAWQTDISEKEKAFNQISGELNGKEKELERLLADKPSLDEAETADTLNAAMAQIATDIENKNKAIGAARQQLADDHAKRERIQGQLSECEKLKEEHERWKMLGSKIGDAEGNKIRKIIQSYVLKAMLADANYYLEQLSDRYRLDCQDLVLTITDSYSGDEIRPVHTLSGGESFLVSLSLALGLSNLNRQGLSIEMLFIDEGFGTLSGEHLNTTMNALEQLNASGRRKVGVISHVEGLRERIKTHIEVTRDGNRTSKVKVVDTANN